MDYFNEIGLLGIPMHRVFYFPFFLHIPARGANYLKLALEKPLLVFGDEFSSFLDGVGRWALLGYQARAILIDKPKGPPSRRI